MQLNLYNVNTIQELKRFVMSLKAPADSLSISVEVKIQYPDGIKQTQVEIVPAITTNFAIENNAYYMLINALRNEFKLQLFHTVNLVFRVNSSERSDCVRVITSRVGVTISRENFVSLCINACTAIKETLEGYITLNEVASSRFYTKIPNYPIVRSSLSNLPPMNVVRFELSSLEEHVQCVGNYQPIKHMNPTDIVRSRSLFNRAKNSGEQCAFVLSSFVNDIFKCVFVEVQINDGHYSLVADTNQESLQEFIEESLVSLMAGATVGENQYVYLDFVKYSNQECFSTNHSSKIQFKEWKHNDSSKAIVNELAGEILAVADKLIPIIKIADTGIGVKPLPADVFELLLRCGYKNVGLRATWEVDNQEHFAHYLLPILSADKNEGLNMARVRFYSLSSEINLEDLYYNNRERKGSLCFWLEGNNNDRLLLQEIEVTNLGEAIRAQRYLRENTALEYYTKAVMDIFYNKNNILRSTNVKISDITEEFEM